MRITFLGTSAGIPTVERGLSSIAVQRGPEMILLDCGEGTQRQIMTAGLNPGRIEKILISHLHGDHVLGIPGVLQTLSLMGRERELLLFGPEGMSEFITGVKDVIGFHLTFPCVVHEICEGIFWEDDEYSLLAAKNDHGIPGFGYAIVERPRPGVFNPERARALGVPEGPLWSILQHGEDVVCNGRMVRSSEIVGLPRPGRKIAYSGDTRPSKSITKLAEGADLLIHEASYEDDLAEMAVSKGHSSASQAVEIASEAQVGRLILTHFSARLKDTTNLLGKVREAFPHADVAVDFLTIEIPLRESQSHSGCARFIRLTDDIS